MNHLSDSVSIVDVAATPPRVVRTLLVGDEPRDIVFAGSGGNRAFITTAHRGQKRTTPPRRSAGRRQPAAHDRRASARADVWVFDATNLGAALGGTPLAHPQLLRRHAARARRDADGTRSTPRSSTPATRRRRSPRASVCDGGDRRAAPCTTPGGATRMPGGLPGPEHELRQARPAPETGLIVKFDRRADSWRDELGRNWNNAVPLRPARPRRLRDRRERRSRRSRRRRSRTSARSSSTWRVNPVSGKLYVSNTEARNRGALRGPRRLRRQHGAGPPARGAHHA